MAGRADLQAVFHWIFQWAEISKLLPYLIHPSWFLNIPCPEHRQLPFSITSSSSFSTTPLPHHPPPPSPPLLHFRCKLVPFCLLQLQLLQALSPAV